MSVATARPLRHQDTVRPDDQRRERLLTIVTVAIPAALAAGLCLYEISVRSLWIDEAATVAIATQHGAAFGSALAHDGGNMLGYYALLHALIGAFGNGSLVLRLPSAIGAVATVVAVGVLGLRLFGRRPAFAAGLLTAVSLPLVYWGQNARGYSLMVALISGSFLALVIALQRGRAGAWVAYGLLTVASVYAGLEAALVIPAQLIVLGWYRSRWRELALTLAAALACCVPLAVLAAERGSGQLFWVPPPSFTTAKQVLDTLASSGLQPNFYTGTGDILLVLTGIVAAIGVVRIWPLVRGPARPGSFGPVLVLAWLVIPFVLALLESAVGQSIFQARYLLVSLPAVALLLSWAALTGRVPAVAGWALVATLIGLRAAQLVPSYGDSPENWRAAASYVVSASRPGDCIAFYPLDNRMPLQYYLRGRAAPRPILPAVPWGRVRAYVEDYATLSRRQLNAVRASCSRVWLFTSHEGTAGGPPISRRNLARLDQLRTSLGRTYPSVTSRPFGTAKTVTLTLLRR